MVAPVTETGVLDASALLEGPRGRRPCLELATMLDSDTRLAVFSAAHALASGSGIVMLASRSEGNGPPTASVEDVAEALAAATWPALRPRDLLVALDRAVASARYWQEPDGEDVLASTPVVRAALAPVAELIAGSLHTGWWSEPCAPSAQWSVVWHEDGRPDLERAGASRTWRGGMPRSWPTRRAPGEMRLRIRGRTSPARGGQRRRRRCRARPGPCAALDPSGCGWSRTPWESATVRRVPVAGGSGVIEIDGPEAWAGLCRRFPLDVTASRRHDWYRTTGRGEGTWVQPNWASVAREADAVHVSVAAYLTTAGRALPVADGVSTVLAGWDPDATIWLTGLGDGADEDPNSQRWAFDRASDTWNCSG